MLKLESSNLKPGSRPAMKQMAETRMFIRDHAYTDEQGVTRWKQTTTPSNPRVIEEGGYIATEVQRKVYSEYINWRVQQFREKIA